METPKPSSTPLQSVEKVTNGLIELVRDLSVQAVDKKVSGVENRVASLEKEKIKNDLTASQLALSEAEKNRKSLDAVNDSVELLIGKTDIHTAEMEGLRECLLALNDQVTSMGILLRSMMTSFGASIDKIEKANKFILDKLKKK